jgi:hypothetical protein
VNTRENVQLTFDPKVEAKIQEIVESNFELYKRITDDPAFGKVLKNFLFDDYIRRHRRAEELLKLQESKTLEFKSSLRWKGLERSDQGAFYVRSGPKYSAAGGGGDRSLRAYQVRSRSGRSRNEVGNRARTWTGTSEAVERHR